MYMVNHEMFTKKMNILIYGDPGAGKTYLAGTAQDHPGMANVHFFNIDGGLMTLAHRGDIRASDVESLEQLEAEMWKIANGHEDYAGINTIVIDNITELQTLSLEGIVERELARGRKNQGKTIDDIFIDDYGKSTRQMGRILRGFRDLPLNKIYLAHRKDNTVGDSRLVESTVPSLTEKLGTAVAGYMDFVWYLYQVAEEEEMDDGTKQEVVNRYLLTQPYDVFLAKTRGELFPQALGPIVRNPNMKEIFDIYFESADLKGD